MNSTPEELSASTWANRCLPGPGEPADAADVATATVNTWHAIQTALTPIIGQRGVAALYRRSLHLTLSTTPWLSEAQGESDLAPQEIVLLKTAIAKQMSADATAGGKALLMTFHRLLVSLVGASLTNRLLQPVRAGTPTETQGPPPWTPK